jgi:hypothetical protein
MSTQSQQRPPEPDPGSTDSRAGQPGGQPGGQDEGEGTFRRTFFTTQAVFVVFALIAAIPEAPSNGSLGADIQLVIVGCLWVLANVVALGVKAAHVHAMRTRH